MNINNYDTINTLFKLKNKLSDSGVLEKALNSLENTKSNLYLFKIMRDLSILGFLPKSQIFGKSLLESFLIYIDSGRYYKWPSTTAEGNISFAIQIIDYYNLDKNYLYRVIDIVISNKSLVLAKNLVDKYDLGYKYGSLLLENALNCTELVLAKKCITDYDLLENYRDCFIETCLKSGEIELLDDFINEYKLHDAYPYKKLIQNSLIINVFSARKLIDKYDLWSEYSLTQLIDIAMYQDILLAKTWIEEGGLTKKYKNKVAERLIFQFQPYNKESYLIEAKFYHNPREMPSFIKTFQWLRTNQVKDEFLINSFCINALCKYYSDVIDSFLTKVFDLSWGDEVGDTILEAVKRGYGKTVKKWHQSGKIEFESYLPPTLLVQTALDTQQTEVAEHWVQKYNLYAEFPQFEPPADAQPDTTVPPDEA